MESLKKIISTNSSNRFRFEIIGQRTCDDCGATVNIIQSYRNGKKEVVSDCINCETLSIKQEHEQFVEKMKRNKHEYIYNRFSIVPDDLKNASFDTYIPNNELQEEILKKARYYADHFDNLNFNSLLMKGSYGLGKSHLAKAISDALKEQGKTVIYLDIPQLLREIKNTFNSTDTADAIYEAIKDADLVIFDDLGSEYVKKDKDGESWVSEVLFELFSSRIGKAKIITTNCSASELKAKYGQNGGRIVSRMLKGARLIEFQGEDMRTIDFYE